VRTLEEVTHFGNDGHGVNSKRQGKLTSIQREVVLVSWVGVRADGVVKVEVDRECPARCLR
jgi:hypothetical protein